MLKRRLFTPGPVPVPDRVRLAMAQPIINHRAADFLPVFRECRTKLQQVFQTKSPVVILSGSGTVAMEAAVSNVLSPGDEALVIRGGKFGERWAEIGEAFGIKVTCIDVEWGKAVDPAAVKKALDQNPAIKAVYIQASETSTATRHPVKEVAEIVRRRDDCLMVVDAITAVGVYNVPMDDWGLDIVVSGSQKAFMLPPGLAFIAMSDRAQKFTKTAKCPRYYVDIAKEIKTLDKDQTAYTPAVSLLMGLAEALKIMVDEIGLEATWARTEKIAYVTREAMKSIGLKMLSESPSPACTGVYLPDGIGADLRKYLIQVLGFTMADGQDQLKGKVLRIAHLGYFDGYDTITVIAAIEHALKAKGYNFKVGEATRCATELLSE